MVPTKCTLAELLEALAAQRAFVSAIEMHTGR